MIAYLALTTGNPDQLALAIYLFGATGIGIKFPNTAMDQFNAGKPWDVAKNAKSRAGITSRDLVAMRKATSSSLHGVKSSL